MDRLLENGTFRLSENGTYRLLENGTFRLLENGTLRLLENATFKFSENGTSRISENLQNGHTYAQISMEIHGRISAVRRKSTFILPCASNSSY